MISYRDLVNGLRELGLDGSKPTIAHASLSSFGHVQGGAETVIGALLSVTDGLIMPTFTYKTMVTPETGPPNNGLTYGEGGEYNRDAEFYRADMPADALMGIVPETLRQMEETQRSRHPIYSFSGIDAQHILDAQTIEDPFGPIRMLTESQGLVLLLGADQTSNTSIHYGEKFAGRKQFIRWALTPKGIQECPGWPGCSRGFKEITPYLESFIQQTLIGQAPVQAISLPQLTKVVVERISEDPLALLCNLPDCERCQAVRNDINN